MQRVAVATENRAVRDRRCFTWHTVFFGFARSRRKNSRRELDGEPVFTDWHHPWLFFLAVSIMIFSSLDAFLTLQLLSRGAVEINPFMDSLIGHSAIAFASFKMSLTATGLLALVFLSRARFMQRVRTGLFLTVIFAVYACLVCYEFVLLMQVI